MIITIDGPAASGKSTVARGLAQRLHGLYLSSGLLYRAVAYLLTDSCGMTDTTDYGTLDPHDLSAVIEQLSYRMDARGDALILYRGTNIIPLLRSPHVDMITSRMSVQPVMRGAVNEWQRRLVSAYAIAVVDGRDAGTVVFPTAEYSFFLTASPRVRAQRLYDAYAAQGMASLSLAEIYSALCERDERDRTRSVAPLRPADRAIVIDATERTADETLEMLLAVIEDSKRQIQ